MIWDKPWARASPASSAREPARHRQMNCSSNARSAAAATEWRRQDPKLSMIKDPERCGSQRMFQPDQTVAACALRQGTAWRVGHFTFRAAPCGDAETDADQQCCSAAETTPGPRVMWKNQRGDHSQVQPDRTTQPSQDAPARPAASGEHPGQREYGWVLGVVQPPAPAGRWIGPADLSRVGDGCGGKKTGTRQHGKDEHCA